MAEVGGLGARIGERPVRADEIGSFGGWDLFEGWVAEPL